ncbi:MAG: acetate/propionate family kinase [Rudaea sp.]
MTAALLAVNAGSSSLKFALYADDKALTPLGKGEVSGLGSVSRLRTCVAGRAAAERALGDVANAADALQVMLDWLAVQFADIHFSAIGHRVVHGGSRFCAPIVIDDGNLHELEALDPLAPQHQPFNLEAIRALRKRFPQSLPVACFDTAFHAHWDDAAKRIALPRRFHDAGIRRYGFHGLSYEFLSERVRMLAPAARRVVLAHLGSGASICATLDGRSVESTMGFSALDGLPMATRSGALDPSIIFHLRRQHAMNFEDIEHTLYYESGLKGISGISADMRDLLASDRCEARQAIDLFVHRCRQAVGAMIAVLGGVDALVISGGIGAHSAPVRAAICSRLEYAGIHLDAGANAIGSACISVPMSNTPVFALATNEESVIARHCQSLLAACGKTAACAAVL